MSSSISKSSPSEASSNREFQAIDGLRTLLSLWVVACHTCGMIQFFTFYQSPENPQQIYEVYNGWWPSIALGLGFQVDIFFLISGFLTSLSLLKAFHKPSKSTNQSTQPLNSYQLINKEYSWIQKVVWLSKETLFFLFKRLLRLWPATLAAIIITILVGDYQSNNIPLLFSLFSYPLERNLPSAFTVQWSNRVDLECTIVLFIIIHLYFFFFQINPWTILMTIVFSLLPKYWRFMTFQPRLSYVQLKTCGNIAEILNPPYMITERHEYFDQILYPNAFQAQRYASVGPLLTNLFTYDYKILHQRITPFFVGLFLACLLYQQQNKVLSETTNDKSKQPSKLSSFLNNLKHLIALIVSVLILCQPILIGWGNFQKLKKEPFTMERFQMLSQPKPDPSFVTDFYISVLNRTCYASSLAYMFYRILLPKQHKLSFSWLNQWLSQTWLVSLSKYSYALYVIHMKVMMEIMWRYLPFDYLNKVFLPVGTPLFYHFLIYLGLTYVCSLIFAI